MFEKIGLLKGAFRFNGPKENIFYMSGYAAKLALNKMLFQVLSRQC